MSLARLKQEEADMDKMYYSKASDKDPEAGTPDLSAETTFETEPVVTEDLAKDFSEPTLPDTKESTEEPEKSKRTNWKKRYTNFKASADTTIFQLRQENAQLKENVVALRGDINDLNGQLDALKPSTFDGSITQEDEDTIGPDAVRIMKKTTEAVSKPLQKELEALRKEKLEAEARAAKAARQSASESFKGKIESLVEDFDSLDVNPKFMTYLDETDPLTGQPRRVFFDKAVSYGDFVRTAGFYNDFAKTLPQSKAEILGKKVSPLGGGATPTGGVGKPKTYSLDEYNETYALYNKGGFRTQEERTNLLNKMDLMDQAFVEGRIT